MAKLLVLLIPALCAVSVDAARRMRKGVLDQVESEVEDMQESGADMSNQALWLRAWKETTEKYHVADADINDEMKRNLMPEAQKLWKSFLQARHQLKQKQQSQESKAQTAADSDAETLEDLKQQMAEKLTAHLKDIKDDDVPPPVETTTTTSTESPDQVRMDELREKEREKLTAHVKDVKDDDESQTTTAAASTTESAQARQAREDNEKLAELKDEMAKKLTEDHPEGDAGSKSFVQEQTTTTTTTTVTMDEAEQEKTMSLLKTGNLGGNLFTRFQKPKPAPVEVKVAAQPEAAADSSSDSEGEVSQDFDQYDSMDS